MQFAVFLVILSLVENANQQSSVPQQPGPQAHSQHPHMLFMGLGAVALIGMGLLGGYLLWGNNRTASLNVNERNQAVTTATQASPTQVVTEAPIKALESNIPADWTYHASTLCDVSFPIPPKKEPYYTIKLPTGGATNDNNRYWRLRDTKDNGIFLFKDSAFALYEFETPPQLGNGYTPGLVRVFCAPNTEDLTTLALVNKVDEEGKRSDRSGQIVSKRQTQKWGETVYAVIFDGLQGATVNKNNERYFYADAKKIYFIDAVSESSNQVVRDTTEKILNNIRL